MATLYQVLYLKPLFDLLPQPKHLSHASARDGHRQKRWYKVVVYRHHITEAIGKMASKKSSQATHNRSSSQTVNMAEATVNTLRSSTSLIDHFQLGLVNHAAAGRRFLEKRLLFVPEGHPATTRTLANTLLQIAALGKVPREAVQAIWSAAFLLD